MQHPRGERDLVAGQAVRVAGPVVALVGVAQDPGRVFEMGNRAQHALGDDRMLAQHFELLV